MRWIEASLAAKSLNRATLNLSNAWSSMKIRTRYGLNRKGREVRQGIFFAPIVFFAVSK
jgi:hypothetical protein